MKKFLSIAMSAAMVASMMTTAAVADEADDFDPGTGKVYYLNWNINPNLNSYFNIYFYIY